MTLKTATGIIALAPAEAREVAGTLLASDDERIDAREADETGKRLDREGLVAHRLVCGGPVLTCLPMRAPPGPRPHRMSCKHLRLSPFAVLRAVVSGLSLERPDGWARIDLHDPAVLTLMPLLAAGASAQECARAVAERSDEWTIAVLLALHWCGMLAAGEEPDWPLPDLMLHTATRQGYIRKHLGKSQPPETPQEPSAQKMLARRMLDIPNPAHLARTDPPFATVAADRRARRHHGAAPLTARNLSDFLYRTLHETDGRRPYPSGGACYPLTGYLALHRSADVPAGLYRYDAQAHCLDMVAESGIALNRLLDDAAANAGVSECPQALLILSARFEASRRIYKDLSYSLILKEVGAVMQMAMLAAAATGLATCPLGTGNAPAFSALAGLDPRRETSVGELMLGTLGDEVNIGSPSR